MRVFQLESDVSDFAVEMKSVNKEFTFPQLKSRL
jgi:hypothetical protein